MEEVPEGPWDWRSFLWGPWDTRMLVANLIVLSIVVVILSFTVFDTGWAGVRSGLTAAAIVGIVCVL